MQRAWWIAVFIVTVVGIDARSTQGPALANVMRQKLSHSQSILEAVVTSNWTALDTETRALERLTTDPRWTVLKSPEYAAHSAAFVKAVQDLGRAAEQRNLENTPKAYVEMTLKCVECHRYLARARIAR